VWGVGNTARDRQGDDVKIYLLWDMEGVSELFSRERAAIRRGEYHLWMEELETCDGLMLMAQGDDHIA